MEEKTSEPRGIGVDINALGNAMIIYDPTTDTLHINITDEEADEVILLENGIIVRIKNGMLIGITVQNITRST